MLFNILKRFCKKSESQYYIKNGSDEYFLHVVIWQSTYMYEFGELAERLLHRSWKPASARTWGFAPFKAFRFYPFLMDSFPFYFPRYPIGKQLTGKISVNCYRYCYRWKGRHRQHQRSAWLWLSANTTAESTTSGGLTSQGSGGRLPPALFDNSLTWLWQEFVRENRYFLWKQQGAVNVRTTLKVARWNSRSSYYHSYSCLTGAWLHIISLPNLRVRY